MKLWEGESLLINLFLGNFFIILFKDEFYPGYQKLPLEIAHQEDGPKISAIFSQLGHQYLLFSFINSPKQMPNNLMKNLLNRLKEKAIPFVVIVIMRFVVGTQFHLLNRQLGDESRRIAETEVGLK